MARVRYHEMLPREIRARRDACPIAFVGIGTLEWHAHHAAVGLDGLKAERLCELAAEASGGFAFPTAWYGEPWSSQHMDADQKETPAIRDAFGLRPRPRASTAAIMAEIVAFEALVQRIALQLYQLEMRVICMLCGHFPLRDWALPVQRRLASARHDAVTVVGTEVDFAQHAGCQRNLVGNDHAGVWETSYLWFLRPDCVDMAVYEQEPDKPLVGVIGDDPRVGASPELGQRACEVIVDGMVARAQSALRGLREADSATNSGDHDH
jgi:creatinine amidohydrolase